MTTAPRLTHRAITAVGFSSWSPDDAAPATAAPRGLTLKEHDPDAFNEGDGVELDLIVDAECDSVVEEGIAEADGVVVADEEPVPRAL